VALFTWLLVMAAKLTGRKPYKMKLDDEVIFKPYS
jgi:hypothetical protein